MSRDGEKPYFYLYHIFSVLLAFPLSCREASDFTLRDHETTLWVCQFSKNAFHEYHESLWADLYSHSHVEEKSA